MDNGLCLRAAFTESEYMGHNVVPDLMLVRGGGGIIDVGEIGPHLSKLFLAYIQAQLLLALSQGEPEPAPGGKLGVVGEKPFHFLVGISAAEGVFVKFVHNRLLCI